MNRFPHNLDPHKLRELQDLMVELCDGELRPDELARLEELVCSDEECCEYYLTAMYLHANLPRYVVRDADIAAEHFGRWEELVGMPFDPSKQCELNDIKATCSGPTHLTCSGESEKSEPIVSSRSRALPSVLSTLSRMWGGNRRRAFRGLWRSKYLPVAIAIAVAFVAVAMLLRYQESDLGDAAPKGVSGATSLAHTEPDTSWVDDPDYVMPPSVAQVVRLRDAVWSSVTPAPMVGAFVEPNQRLELLRGSAEIYFDSGAVVVLEGPAKFEPISRSQAYLHYGRLVAKVPQAAIGFWVDTPSIQVIDLGTEFGIEVDSKKNANVHVLSGAVVAQPKSGVRSELRRIENQESLRFNAQQSRFDQAKIDGRLFSQLLSQTERTSVIAAAVANNGKPYRVLVGGLDDDAVAYIDRRFQWNGFDSRGIPPELLGADYVQTANDDKTSRDFELRVMITVPATLYVFFDKRIKAIPDWLERDFVNTGSTIGLDIDVRDGKLGEGPGDDVELQYSVWKRRVVPGTVTLGPTQSKGPGHYGVAAVPDTGRNLDE